MIDDTVVIPSHQVRDLLPLPLCFPETFLAFSDVGNVWRKIFNLKKKKTVLIQLIRDKDKRFTTFSKA